MRHSYWRERVDSKGAVEVIRKFVAIIPRRAMTGDVWPHPLLPEGQ